MNQDAFFSMSSDRFNNWKRDSIKLFSIYWWKKLGYLPLLLTMESTSHWLHASLVVYIHIYFHLRILFLHKIGKYVIRSIRSRSFRCAWFSWIKTRKRVVCLVVSQEKPKKKTKRLLKSRDYSVSEWDQSQ